MKHYRFNVKGTYNLNDGALANQTTLWCYFIMQTYFYKKSIFTLPAPYILYVPQPLDESGCECSRLIHCKVRC